MPREFCNLQSLCTSVTNLCARETNICARGTNVCTRVTYLCSRVIPACVHEFPIIWIITEHSIHIGVCTEKSTQKKIPITPTVYFVLKQQYINKTDNHVNSITMNMDTRRLTMFAPTLHFPVHLQNISKWKRKKKICNRINDFI